MLLLIFAIGYLLAGETVSTYKIKGMTCAFGCPQKVEESLKDVEGIKSCKVDFSTQTAIVTYDDQKIDSDNIAKTITDATYFKAVDKEGKKTWAIFDWLFGE